MEARITNLHFNIFEDGIVVKMWYEVTSGSSPKEYCTVTKKFDPSISITDIVLRISNGSERYDNWEIFL